MMVRLYELVHTLAKSEFPLPSPDDEENILRGTNISMYNVQPRNRSNLPYLDALYGRLSRCNW